MPKYEETQIKTLRIVTDWEPADDDDIQQNNVLIIEEGTTKDFVISVGYTGEDDDDCDICDPQDIVLPKEAAARLYEWLKEIFEPKAVIPGLVFPPGVRGPGLGDGGFNPGIRRGQVFEPYKLTQTMCDTKAVEVKENE